MAASGVAGHRDTMLGQPPHAAGTPTAANDDGVVAFRWPPRRRRGHSWLLQVPECVDASTHANGYLCQEYLQEVHSCDAQGLCDSVSRNAKPARVSEGQCGMAMPAP